MPSNPKEHFEYTVREWSNNPFIEITRALPENISVIYDIGANAGGFTQVMKNKYPDVKAYCFEPVAENYESLINNVPYATCFQKGIFYGQKLSRVLWRGGNVGAFFVDHIDAGEPRVHHNDQYMELDELENFSIDKPELIKIDVEGAELNIIEHSKIVKECPYLIVEWHPSDDPIAFFKKHLPHKIVVNLDNNQFLLKND